MGINKIYTEAGLTQCEKKKMARYLDSDDDFYGTPSYDKLYEYFCNTGEMPYGIAKARTGDPDIWILDTLGVIDG